MDELTFWRGKRVFLTGHTGFKGAWLCKILQSAGARVGGYALAPDSGASLFKLAGLEQGMESVTGDVRNFEALKRAFDRLQPEIVIHMAAQPLVRDSYIRPVYTYETNVMGTIHILECVRLSQGVKSFLNVTTDKVYRNNEWEWGYRETDPLDGYDPYSNSKSCAELATHSYRSSFLAGAGVAVSTARAGNVIGGGDFAADRIVPDCVRAVGCGRQIEVRNPYSTRPYQHVLEPLFAYMMIARRQYEDAAYAGYYNVGPDDGDCVTTGALVELFCKKWGEGSGWVSRANSGAPHEAGLLKLDCSRIKSVFGWSPRWDIETAIQKTVEWSKAYLAGGDVRGLMEKQIVQYMQNGERE